MASRTITTLTDDIDGSDADETITFAFKGMTYEIDLSKKNSRQDGQALQPYTTAARTTGGPRSGTGRTTRRGADKDQLAKIRDWARANGHHVSDGGRISTAVKSPTTPPTEDRIHPKAAHPRSGVGGFTVFSTSRLERYQTSASVQQRHPGQGPDAIQDGVAWVPSQSPSHPHGGSAQASGAGRSQAVVLRGEVAGDEMVA